MIYEKITNLAILPDDFHFVAKNQKLTHFSHEIVCFQRNLWSTLVDYDQRQFDYNFHTNGLLFRSPSIFSRPLSPQYIKLQNFIQVIFCVSSEEELCQWRLPTTIMHISDSSCFFYCFFLFSTRSTIVGLILVGKKTEKRKSQAS